MDKETAKKEWFKDVLNWMDPGLCLLDKVIIKHLMDKFVDDYVEAKGEINHFISFGDIYLFYEYVSPYGYSMPRAEKLVDIDLVTIRKNAERRNVKVEIHNYMRRH